MQCVAVSTYTEHLYGEYMGRRTKHHSVTEFSLYFPCRITQRFLVTLSQSFLGVVRLVLS